MNYQLNDNWKTLDPTILPSVNHLVRFIANILLELLRTFKYRSLKQTLEGKLETIDP
jgi:hypothetical protein